MSNGNVVSLAERSQTKHRTGEAKCLACEHTWVAVAPIGVNELQCPECDTMRGVFANPFGLGDEYLIYTCGCENELMRIARHDDGGYWIECCKCGHLHSIDTVFPA